MQDNQKIKFILLYQYILATAFVFTFFTNLDVYLNHAIGTPQPKNVVLLFGIASIPVILSLPSRIKYTSPQIIKWMSGYLLISFISFFFFYNNQPLSSSQEFRIRILSVFFMFLSLSIFSHPQVQKLVRYEILVITLINVVTNVYSLIYPENFVTVVDHQDLLETSRAAGFYVDANRAACVLMLGLILGINLLGKKYHLPFILATFIGTLVTFSRSGFISFIAVILILSFQRKLIIFNQKIFFFLLSIGIAAWMIINSVGLSWLNAEYAEYIEENIVDNRNLERITQVQSLSRRRELDDLSSSRLPIVEKTWSKFLESPFVGNGIGYGLKLSESNMGKRSHNMYLYFMLEHGFLGLLVFPSLILYSISNYPRANQATCIAFATLIGIWGFFSHNILEHREFLMSFVLISTINITSSFK